MPVIVRHVYIAQCQWCDWVSVGKLTESAAQGLEQTHVTHEHSAVNHMDGSRDA